MKKRRKFLWWALIFIFMAPLYQGCKKYDEGPAFSLRSKKTRLIGEWEVTSYLENEKDVLNNGEKVIIGYDNCQYTETYKGNLSYVFEFEKGEDVIITENYNYSSYSKEYNTSDPDYYCSYYNCCDTSYSYSESGIELYFGEWEFRKNKKELRLEINYDGSLSKEDYEIIRLTNDELKLKGFIGGGFNNPIKKVEIELKKK